MLMTCLTCLKLIMSCCLKRMIFTEAADLIAAGVKKPLLCVVGLDSEALLSLWSWGSARFWFLRIPSNSPNQKTWVTPCLFASGDMQKFSMQICLFVVLTHLKISVCVLPDIYRLFLIGIWGHSINKSVRMKAMTCLWPKTGINKGSLAYFINMSAYSLETLIFFDGMLCLNVPK